MLVVDDSALMRGRITHILGEDPQLEVIGVARDGVEALAMIDDKKPDVITLDVDMPRMNGISALKNIMVRHGTPTVMISSLTTEGARITFDALKFGAVDVIAKPSAREDETLDNQRADMITKVKRAATIRTGASRYVRVAGASLSSKRDRGDLSQSPTWFIGMGAGTGAYCSLLKIITSLPAEFCEVLLAVILVSSRYIDPFVAYLAAHSAVPVRNALGAPHPEKGVCYVCSSEDGLTLGHDGNTRVRFARKGPGLQDGSEGAIDKMFKSLAGCLGNRAVGVVLSGQGRDGAAGVAEIRRAGGVGVVQNIMNCMDPSMPLAVLELGAVDKILPDYTMPEFFMGLPAKVANVGKG